MQITSIQSTIPELINATKTNPSDDAGFGNILTGLISQVNQDQNNEDKLTKQFVTGGNVEIQDVMIAGEKAKTSLDLLIEIRNQTLDMYKQLTQIPV